MSVESFPSSGDGRPPDKAAVPATPFVRPDELWQGTPNVLFADGRYTIGQAIQDWLRDGLDGRAE